MFQIGDVIQRPNKNEYSHANIYSSSFVITGITKKDYILRQPNFTGNMNINTVNAIFILDNNPKGYIVDIRDHILKNLS